MNVVLSRSRSVREGRFRRRSLAGQARRSPHLAVLALPYPSLRATRSGARRPIAPRAPLVLRGAPRQSCLGRNRRENDGACLQESDVGDKGAEAAEELADEVLVGAAR